tara:strand:- start:848 stop:2416 length:1569 start_codon:yes stop_codon:yes gene_type:complete
MDKLKEQIQSVVNVYKSGNLSKAEEVTTKLIESNPKIAFLYNLLGLILMGQKKLDKAVENFHKGLKIDPGFALIYNNLGLLFAGKKTDESYKQAKNYYKKSISLDNNNPEPHTNLGNLYNSVNKYEEAIDCHKEAININPKLPISYFNLSNEYLALGNLNEAEKNLRRSIKLKPNFFIAHRNLSRIIKYTKDEEHFNELNKIFKNIDENDIDFNIHISFALAKAYDDIKDFDKSFQLFEKANSLSRKRINFSIKSEKKLFSKVKKIFDKKIYRKFKDVGYLDFSPIFIVGMPRSGTTLVEQILSSHKKVFGADEVNFIPNLIQDKFGKSNSNLSYESILEIDKGEFKIIGREYHNKMSKISNNSVRTTDKLPINFLNVGFIKLILPNSKIIHCTRNPKDTILSIYKNHFPGGQIKYGYNLSELVDYYNLYSNLMTHWSKILPNFIFDLNYEDLINDNEKKIKNMLNFCNLDWQNDCLRFYNNKRPIKTASDVQARKKIYNTSINTWKNYEKHLNDFFANLNN